MSKKKPAPTQALKIPPKRKRPGAEYILSALECAMDCSAEQLARTVEMVRDGRGNKRERLAKIVENLDELKALVDEELEILDQL